MHSKQLPQTKVKVGALRLLLAVAAKLAKRQGASAGAGGSDLAARRLLLEAARFDLPDTLTVAVRGCFVFPYREPNLRRAISLVAMLAGAEDNPALVKALWEELAVCATEGAYGFDDSGDPSEPAAPPGGTT